MLLRLDELNALRGDITRYKGDSEKIKDLILDWLLLAYADGVSDVASQLGGSWDAPIERVDEVVNEEIGGATVMERVEQYLYLEDYEAIINVIDNERSRIYNTACFDAANEMGAKTKTWHTMQDFLVRDSHFYLDEVTKPLNEEYHTILGNSGQHPGGFDAAEDDINCRCWLTFSK